MSAPAVPWFEDEDLSDIRRWAIAALIVVSVHIGAIASYLYVHVPDDVGDDAPAVAVEVSPSDDTVDQAEVTPVPEQQQEQKQVEEQPPPTPPPPPDAVAMPEEKPVEQPQVQPQQAPQPARTKSSSSPVSATWETSLVKRLNQFKRYPGEAQSRGVEGVVLLSFSVDRNGHVLSHRIVRSSGHPELDAEVTSMIERAQPLPAFPASMTDDKLDLTVPIRFSLR
jgi:periplasmic protein TonB